MCRACYRPSCVAVVLPVNTRSTCPRWMLQVFQIGDLHHSFGLARIFRLEVLA